MAKVKCLYCGEYFDREKEPCQKIGRRYAHQECYDKNYGADDEYKQKIYGLVKELFGPKYDYPAIERQRQKYNKDGLDNEAIYKALYYYYFIKQNSVNGANGRIGIVPYVVTEAQNYYRQKEESVKRIKNAKDVLEYKVNLDAIKKENTFKRDFINLDDLE